MPLNRDALTTAILLVLLAASVAVSTQGRLWGVAPDGNPNPTEPIFVEQWHDLLGSGVRLGPASAKVQLVEFIDLECPSCRKFHEVLLRVRHELRDDLAVTLIPYPLPYHARAEPAARALHCADGAGFAEQFLQEVFADPLPMRSLAWAEYAARVGIEDTVGFNRCRDGDAADSAVQHGKDLGARFGVEATPTLIISGWRFQGSYPSSGYMVDFAREIIKGRRPMPENQAVRRISPSGDTTIIHPAITPSLRRELLALSRASAGTMKTPPLDLSRLLHASLLDDTTVIVATFGPLAVSRISLATGAATTILPEGEGPGSVRAIGGLVTVSPETLMVSDPVNLRVTSFSPTGAIHWTQSLTGADGRPILPPSHRSFHGRLADGRLVFSNAVTVQTSTRRSAWRDTTVVVALDTTKRLEEIARVASREMTGQVLDPSNPSLRLPVMTRFSPQAHVATWNGALAITTGESLGVRRLQPPATIGLSVILADAIRVVSTDMVAASRKLDPPLRPAGGNERGRLAARYVTVMAERPVRMTLPWINAVFTADDMIWLQTYPDPKDGAWHAIGIGGSGTLVHTLSGIGDSRPVAFSNKAVLLLGESESGEPTLSLKPFSLSPGARH